MTCDEKPSADFPGENKRLPMIEIACTIDLAGTRRFLNSLNLPCESISHRRRGHARNANSIPARFLADLCRGVVVLPRVAKSCARQSLVFVATFASSPTPHPENIAKSGWNRRSAAALIRGRPNLS
jgi:hypothetical protein